MNNFDKRIATLQRSEAKHQRSIFGAIASMFSRDGRAEIVPTEKHSQATVARYTQVEVSSKSGHIIDG